MKLFSFEDSNGSAYGTFVDKTLINLASLARAYETAVLKEPVLSSSDIVEFLARGYAESARLEELLHFFREGNLHQTLAVASGYRMRAPVPRPPKIIAVGRNYVLHVQETKSPIPDEPIIFCKSNSSVIGPNGTILIPTDVGRVDHEVELGVIIGKRAKKVQAQHAYEHVAGYTIALDITARDLQHSDIKKRQPWYRSKNFDTFTPLGPWMVTADEIPPPIELDIALSVNGQIQQQANTREMIFDVATTIEFITKYITLEPGDVILMGTPEGIGPIEDGDHIVSRIQKIGEMANTVKSLKF
jgi:2-keto-4-pentenoate hydratase/2-oxohepta-3-ene-1,7-dioic acid hydratase in catechol pathway